MYEIIIGRSEEDKKRFGDAGVIFLGRHYVKMGQTTSLSNKIMMDVTRSHIVFVCGKRGGGKSYTMGAIAEEMASLPEEISQNLSVILLDTMGVYWTMKFPNYKDAELLKEWSQEPRGLDIKIYTPVGYFKKFKDSGVPTDYPFSIKPSDLNASDWCMTFEISLNDSIGILIERIITNLKETGKDYSMEDIVAEIKKDTESDKDTKLAAENRFMAADSWGVFSQSGTDIESLAKGGQITVLDMSCYATMGGGWKIKALVIGLVAQKLFVQRMVARKKEEFEAVKMAEDIFIKEEEKQEKPMVWLVIDEAHEFLPNKGTTIATFPLITLLREGRQPGISLIVASQQPGKIHTDVMTQADIVIAHRLTAKPDVDALGLLMQSYMREGLDKQLDNLPAVRGAAIVFDDINERMYPMRVKPRITWHGGDTPVAIHKKKDEFEL